MTDEPPTGPPPPYPPPPPPPPAWPPYPSHPQPYPQSYPPAPQQPRRSRVPLVLAAVAGVVVLAVAVVVPVVLLTDDEDEPTARASDRASGPAADLSEVQTFDDLPTTHVEDPVDYAQVPPVGGEHFAQWLDCGVYDEPVPDENAVHDLEHGTVWITYDPALGEDDVAALAGALPQNGILSPYDGLPAPVVVTVWGAQLALTGADDPRLELFVEEYDDGVTAPEPMASCAGGTASVSDGQPA